MSKVRVRFAPSPTGYMHIGGLRTALYNYLFAQKMGGDFILRIEDTDQSRFVEDSLEDIKKSLRWLGIDWQEGPEVGGNKGPYLQSERLDLYNKYVNQLLEEDKAYRCFCTSKRLTEMRDRQRAAKQPPRYDEQCRDLSQKDVSKLIDAGTPFVVRLKTPHVGNTIVKDYLRGEMEFQNALLDDFIILKSDGFPTYHLASVVDDTLMEITHVMRGDEWISSTPKHKLLYDNLGFKVPEFVHLPIIKSAGGGKLSKRDGATNVFDFIKIGYLKEALINFLALLGWAYDGNTHTFSMDFLKENFDIDKLGTTSAIFDRDKLDDYNGKYIREKTMDELVELTMPYMKEAGLISGDNAEQVSYFKKIIPLVFERLKVLSEIVEFTKFFFDKELDYGEGKELIPKKTTAVETVDILKQVMNKLVELESYSEEDLEKVLRSLAENSKYKTGQIFMSLRVAVTGSKVSPGLFETISVLGKEKTIKRVTAAVKFIEDKLL